MSLISIWNGILSNRWNWVYIEWFSFHRNEWNKIIHTRSQRHRNRMLNSFTMHVSNMWRQLAKYNFNWVFLFFGFILIIRQLLVYLLEEPTQRIQIDTENGLWINTDFIMEPTMWYDHNFIRNSQISNMQRHSFLKCLASDRLLSEQVNHCVWVLEQEKVSRQQVHTQIKKWWNIYTPHNQIDKNFWIVAASAPWLRWLHNRVVESSS